jgi:hypothetical protein
MSTEQGRLRRLASQGEAYEPIALLRAMANQDQRALQAVWRAGKNKPLRELRDACLFAHGLALRYKSAVTVLAGEVEDYDFVLRKVAADGVFEVMGVQLKELPPEHLNPEISLPELLASQAQRPSTDATLLVSLNRTGYIPDELLGSVPLPYAELWYLWSPTPDGSRWCIHGDALHQSQTFEFALPAQHPPRYASRAA